MLVAAVLAAMTTGVPAATAGTNLKTTIHCHLDEKIVVNQTGPESYLIPELLSDGGKCLGTEVPAQSPFYRVDRVEGTYFGTIGDLAPGFGSLDLTVGLSSRTGPGPYGYVRLVGNRTGAQLFPVVAYGSDGTTVGGGMVRLEGNNPNGWWWMTGEIDVRVDTSGP
ncbi:MAG TPA: hypothetical protein VGN69_01860 [Solirubrobacteraceae bacterium]|nr:hypothetical protein [Solirubrobacteraceae bacterium]